MIRYSTCDKNSLICFCIFSIEKYNFVIACHIISDYFFFKFDKYLLMEK